MSKLLASRFCVFEDTYLGINVLDMWVYKWVSHVYQSVIHKKTDPFWGGFSMKERTNKILFIYYQFLCKNSIILNDPNSQLARNQLAR